MDDTFGFDVDFDPRPTLGASEADPLESAAPEALKAGPVSRGDVAVPVHPTAAGSSPAIASLASLAPLAPMHFEFVRYSPRINHLGPDASLVLVRAQGDKGPSRWLWMDDEQVEHNIRVFGPHPALLQARTARLEWYAHSPSYRRRRIR